MKLSLYSELALLAIIYLSRTETASLIEIASTYEIAVEPLEEILSALSQSHYVKQVDGGFTLLKSADEISVVEIIRLFDGALAPLEPVSSKGYATAPMDKEDKLVGLFEQLQSQILERLENTTIRELV